MRNKILVDYTSKQYKTKKYVNNIVSLLSKITSLWKNIIELLVFYIMLGVALIRGVDVKSMLDF